MFFRSTYVIYVVVLCAYVVKKLCFETRDSAVQIKMRAQTPLIAIPEHYPDNNKDEDGAYTSAAQFFGADTGNKSSKDIVHGYTES